MSPRPSGAGRAPAARADPQVPVFEAGPAFEEETGRLPAPGPVVQAMLDERSPPGEQLRLLATRLRALGRDKRLRRIGVVGAGAGEGTSTVALGLAQALASEPRGRVLLVELDLDRPALDGALGLEAPKVGVREYLDGKDETPVVRRPAGSFWLLSAGAAPAGRRDSLASPRLDTLLRAADRVFACVVADCPPLLETAATATLQDALDGLVLVVRSRHAPREVIRQAAARLRPGRIVGVVLNAQRSGPRPGPQPTLPSRLTPRSF